MATLSSTPKCSEGYDDRLEFLRSGNSTVEGTAFPLRNRFEHRAERAEGPVEVVYYPRRDGQCPEQISLFIPGNPGLIDYYIPFLTHLHSLLPTSHALLCTSHIGHEGHLPTQPPTELHDLLESKIELVTALRQSLDTWASDDERKESGKTKRAKIVLVGHSLGGWLVCGIMKRLNTSGREDVIHSGHLLFPSLGWMAKTWNGKVMWPLFSPLVIKTLPTLSYFLRPILPLTTFPPTTLSLLRSPSTIQHCLQLARSELRDIQAPDFEWISAQVLQANNGGDETRGLFGVWSAGRQDGWVGQDGPLVQSCLGGMEGDRVRVLDRVPHAFCLAQTHSETVAEIVAGWLTGQGQS